MSLETLVDEIRQRGEADLKALAESRAKEESAVATERDRRIDELNQEAARASELEAARTRAQTLAAAKLSARKMLYAAREERLTQSLAATRSLLSESTAGADYAGVLRRMFATASESLGASLRVSGRAEDAAVLRKIAGKAFDPTPRMILGGLIAETVDGRRRLDFSFDELLRLRSDKVRGLLA